MTPEQLDAVDLDAIRERVRHATPGPWYVTADGGTIRTDRVADRARGHLAEDEVVFEDARPFNSAAGVRDDDAEFLAHARTDVPALLAEVERLRADLDAAYTAFESVKGESVVLLEAYADDPESDPEPCGSCRQHLEVQRRGHELHALAKAARRYRRERDQARAALHTARRDERDRCAAEAEAYPDADLGPYLRNLPAHRTEATAPAESCATCEGGGCPDCTDPSDR